MAIRWKWMRVPKPEAAAPTAFAARVDESLTELPDLRPFPRPIDKAHVLLEAAAEVEHMLLVQYLYAALTLKTGTALLDLQPDAQKAVRAWREVLMKIAIEEMGHLMAVQNLRLFAAAEPVFDREAFPPAVDIYPFALHLEPLSATSLAKYVLAEAPFSADPELDRYRELVGQKASVRHVGIIYGLLAVLFSSRDTLPPPDAQDDWSQFVARVAAVANATTDPDGWHVPEPSLNPGSVERQADPGHFPAYHAGFFFDHVSNQVEARELIRRIGVQGEAPVDAPDEISHYRRFRGMFEGSDTVVGFPSDGRFVPSLDVDIDPRLESYDGSAREVATALDAAYAAMLRNLTDYFSVSQKADRDGLSAAALDQMKEVRRLAKDLVQLPQREGSARWASPIFSVPK